MSFSKRASKWANSGLVSTITEADAAPYADDGYEPLCGVAFQRHIEREAAVMGGGSMGLLHLLVIKAVYPYAKVLLIDPVADRCTLANELGADETAAPGEDALAAVSAMTDGYGVDAVFDTVVTGLDQVT